MAFGCLCVALANLVMAARGLDRRRQGERAAGSSAISSLATIGELHLAPVGLALISTVAPVRMRSMMMGVWFATTLPADILGGFLGGFWSSMAKADFFLMIAAVAALGSAAIWATSRAVGNR